ncbi:MAG: hypothetical protein ABFS41_11380 [Myxococcota bacterium]
MGRALAALVVSLLVPSCSPALGPFELAAAEGVAVDRETGEPIRGGWVVQWYLGATVPGATRPERAARFARTDADGAFRFEAVRAEPRLWVQRADGPSYSLYHPAYGLVHTRVEPTGSPLRLPASLRDSALRLADLQPFCSGARKGKGAARLAQIACAPTTEPLPAPHAKGPVDAVGHRTGVWIFTWEDGSVAARGRYQNGAATGDWEHFDRSGRRAD